jgi:hypothetical protein
MHDLNLKSAYVRLLRDVFAAAAAHVNAVSQLKAHMCGCVRDSVSKQGKQ